MHQQSRFRQWINRDDGRHYRVGNRAVGLGDVVGLVLVVGALILWQAHVVLGVSGLWALGAGSGGLLLVVLSHQRSHNHSDA